MTDYPGSDDARYGRAGWHRPGGRPGDGQRDWQRDWQRTGERLLGWLRTRPAESWAFFAAGLVLAALFT